jgi:hypothetical protein
VSQVDEVPVVVGGIARTIECPSCGMEVMVDTTKNRRRLAKHQAATHAERRR